MKAFLLFLLLFSFGNITGQSALKIKRKEIKNLEKIAAEKPDVHSLIIKRGRLEQLPEALCLFEQLDSLDLYGNRIEKLEDSILDCLKELRYLRLGKNPMRIFPAGLHKLTKLEELDLWDTELEDFPMELLKMKHLKILDIRATRFTRQQLEEIKAALPDTEIKATWQCNCR